MGLLSDALLEFCECIQPVCSCLLLCLPLPTGPACQSSTAIAGLFCRLRLLLPAGLDTGPVAIHLLSTQAGQEGALLGSVTTMALPPAAAAEVQGAFNLPVGLDTATQAEQQAALRDLMLDYALCWRLCSGSQPAGLHLAKAQETLLDIFKGSTSDDQRSRALAAQQVLSDVLQYLSSCSMSACHALLSDHCTSSGSAQDNLGSDTTSVSPCNAAATPKPTAAAAAAGASPSTTPTASLPCVLPTLASPPVAAAAGGASGPGQHPVACQLQWRPASWLALMASHTANLLETSRGSSYVAWRLQQGRGLGSWAIALTTAAIGICLAGARLAAKTGRGIVWLRSIATVVLHTAPGMAPHVLLAVWGERFRGKKAGMAGAFAVVKLLLCAAGALGWLPLSPAQAGMMGNMRTSVVVNGIFRPCLLQVSGGGLPHCMRCLCLLNVKRAGAGWFSRPDSAWAMHSPPWSGGSAQEHCSCIWLNLLICHPQLSCYQVLEEGRISSRLHVQASSAQALRWDTEPAK